MNITIIGTGYVGLVTGACLSDLGNNVMCLDVDEAKIALLNSGGVPIYEPGLKEIIERNVDAGRLSFTTDVPRSVAHGAIQFIAVGTPPDEDGSADLQYVVAAARNIGRHMTDFKVIVDKSTVPVGTAERVATAIREELDARFAKDAQPGFSVVSNPEFLKEGAAVEDFTRPDRIVLGVDRDAAGERALATMRQVYAPFNRNHERTRVMDVRSAEFTKYAANAMLATRISFMNELAELADAVGADIELVRQGIGSDPRIGYSFLYAGTGYGGSCFPKDLRALMRTASHSGKHLRVLDAVEAVNNQQKTVLVRKIESVFGKNLEGKRFAVWGLAFKPNTDDMRDAPSRDVIQALLRAGASVLAHDPVAADHGRASIEKDLQGEPELLKRFALGAKPMEVLHGADALVIMTEWKAYRSPNWQQLKSAMARPRIFDGRNLFEPEMMRAEGSSTGASGAAPIRQGKPPSARQPRSLQSRRKPAWTRLAGFLLERMERIRLTRDDAARLPVHKTGDKDGDQRMEILLQQIINGLVLGSMYALIALGYTMVYGIINLINFAHGEVLMVGALTSWSIIVTARESMPGIPGWLLLLFSLIIACVVAATLNFTIEKIAYRPLRNSPKLAPLITAIGMSILLQTVAMIIFKPNYKPYPTLLPSTPFEFGGAVITPTQVMILGVTAVSLAILMYLVNFTRLGRAMRATAENPRVAALMGVKPDMVISATFIIGAVLAAIAGVMYASNYGTVQHGMGFLPGLKAFTAAVFGGIGNLAGAVVGGLLLGIIESIGAGYIGSFTGGVLGSQYSDIFAFIVLIAMLTLRPTGLLGERVADRA